MPERLREAAVGERQQSRAQRASLRRRPPSRGDLEVRGACARAASSLSSSSAFPHIALSRTARSASAGVRGVVGLEGFRTCGRRRAAAAPLERARGARARVRRAPPGARLLEAGSRRSARRDLGETKLDFHRRSLGAPPSASRSRRAAESRSLRNASTSAAFLIVADVSTAPRRELRLEKLTPQPPAAGPIAQHAELPRKVDRLRQVIERDARARAPAATPRARHRATTSGRRRRVGPARAAHRAPGRDRRAASPPPKSHGLPSEASRASSVSAPETPRERHAARRSLPALTEADAAHVHAASCRRARALGQRAGGVAQRASVLRSTRRRATNLARGAPSTGRHERGGRRRPATRLTADGVSTEAARATPCSQ